MLGPAKGYYRGAGLTSPPFGCLELELEPGAEADLLRQLIPHIVHRITDQAEVRVQGAKARELELVVVANDALQVPEVEYVHQQSISPKLLELLGDVPDRKRK